MRALVTGGAGFIGSNLVDALVGRGDEVVVVDDFSFGKRQHLNTAAELREHDIRRPFAIDADVVFHLAAQADVQTSMKKPGFDAEVNVVGTVNVLDAAQKCGAQVIFTSSGGTVYGERETPAAEDAPLTPGSAYGTSKLAGETYLAAWNRIYEMQNVVLRLGNVFGPRQDSSLEGGVVSVFLEQMTSGRPTTIFGDGEQARDFVYVGDVVAALLRVAGTPGATYNVGTGTATTINEIHRGCAAVAGVPNEPRYEAARSGDLRSSVLDVRAIERALGWQPQVSLADGLRETFAWMQESGSVKPN